MLSIKSLDKIVLIIVLSGCNGHSLTNRKRSISEVQLMHNVGVHKQVGERQDWLQLKLKDIIAASHAKAQQHGQSGKIRSLLPDDLTGLGLYTS
uniref:Parathyroid hormone n=1 Tax=Oncorhynchus kisutch TaxID=8019 RepID=A0A8C7KA91_ONCKI